MKTLKFKGYDNEIRIIADKITGFTPVSDKRVFISTGADNTSEGIENGWYVFNTFEEVLAIIEEA